MGVPGERADCDAWSAVVARCESFPRAKRMQSDGAAGDWRDGLHQSTDDRRAHDKRRGACTSASPRHAQLGLRLDFGIRREGPLALVAPLVGHVVDIIKDLIFISSAVAWLFYMPGGSARSS